MDISPNLPPSSSCTAEAEFGDGCLGMGSSMARRSIRRIIVISPRSGHAFSTERGDVCYRRRPCAAMSSVATGSELRQTCPDGRRVLTIGRPTKAVLVNQVVEDDATRGYTQAKQPCG